MGRKKQIIYFGLCGSARQTQNLEPSEQFATVATIEAEHDIFQSTSKKTRSTRSMLGKKIFMKLRNVDSQVHE